MVLYEVHAYQTSAYDKRTEKIARLRSGHGRNSLERFIADYLAQYPDGKIVVSECRSWWPGKLHRRKLFVQTAQGKEFV